MTILAYGKGSSNNIKAYLCERKKKRKKEVKLELSLTQNHEVIIQMSIRRNGLGVCICTLEFILPIQEQW